MMKTRAVSKRFLVWLCVSLGLLIVIHLVLQHLNLNVFDEKNAQVFELSNRFDFDDEQSIPTWLSQMIYVLIGLTGLWLYRLEKSVGSSRLWLTIGVGGLLFSLDEVSALHETLLQNIHILFFGESASTVTSNAWLIVLLPIAFGALLLLRTVHRLLPKKTFRLFTFAAISLISGAVLVDVANVSFDKLSYASQGFMVALEESLEILASIIVLYGSVDYLEAKYPDAIPALFKHRR